MFERGMNDPRKTLEKYERTIKNFQRLGVCPLGRRCCGAVLLFLFLGRDRLVIAEYCLQRAAVFVAQTLPPDCQEPILRAAGRSIAMEDLSVPGRAVPPSLICIKGVAQFRCQPGRIMTQDIYADASLASAAAIDTVLRASSLCVHHGAAWAGIIYRDEEPAAGRQCDHHRQANPGLHSTPCSPRGSRCWAADRSPIEGPVLTQM